MAQDILGWSPERLSYVGISAPDPWAWLKTLGENLLPGFAAGLPQMPLHFEDLDQWQVLSLSAQHPVSQFGKSVLFNISALGLLAMLVSWFLMYQVAVSWLRRLWPVFTRLHVLGVEWRTLRGYFVLAMISLGLLAGIVGLYIGKSLAESLFSLTVGDNSTRFALHPWVIGKALMSAVGVCFVGGLWAFRQAQMPVRQPGRSAFVWVGLVVLAGVGVFYPGSGLIGGFMSIALLSVLTAILAGPLLRRIRTYAQYIRGPYLVRLSVREALWYPQDLAVALSGLALAVATAIGVGLMIDSFREDFSRMLERRLSYDLVAQGETHGLQNMLRQVAQSPDVTRIQSYAEGTLRVQGVPLALQIAHMDEVESARYGYKGALGAQQALISEQGARVLSVQVGEVFTVGAEAVQIVGIFQSFGDLQPRLIVDRTHALGALGLALDSVSMNSTASQQLIADLRRQFPQLDLRLQTEIRQLALDTFDRTFTITTVLIVIALLVATIGVYIAVTTLRLNKRVSTRLMAGMGVNRWEDAGMDFALGIGIGFLALLLALPLGVCFGWILCSVINPRAFGWTVDLQLNPATIFWPLFWGMLAASIAGVLRVGRQESPVHARA